MNIHFQPDTIIDEDGKVYLQSDLLKGVKKEISNPGNLCPRSAILIDNLGNKHNLVELLLKAGSDSSTPSKDGKSTYEIWLELGNSGTEQDFINSLKGEKGDKGDTGAKGDPGAKGEPGEKGEPGFGTSEQYNALLERIQALEEKLNPSS